MSLVMNVTEFLLAGYVCISNNCLLNICIGDFEINAVGANMAQKFLCSRSA